MFLSVLSGDSLHIGSVARCSTSRQKVRAPRSKSRIELGMSRILSRARSPHGEGATDIRAGGQAFRARGAHEGVAAAIGGTQCRTRSQQERNSGCPTARAGQRAAEILEAAAVPPRLFPPGIQQNSNAAISP